MFGTIRGSAVRTPSTSVHISILSASTAIPISEADQNSLFELLSDSEYRLHFLLHLNNARAAGKFCISKNTFIQLGQIMYRIVDFISTEKDFESMRYLLIMCQTYFFLNKQGEKFYLVRYIENHKLFQSNEFWEFYFSDSIFQEIEKQNKNEQKEMQMVEAYEAPQVRVVLARVEKGFAVSDPSGSGDDMPIG